MPPKKRYTRRLPAKRYRYSRRRYTRRYSKPAVRRRYARRSYAGSLRMGQAPPAIVNSKSRGGVIIRHREYLDDISPSAAWNPTKYSLNPGQSTTFPWLAVIAQAYQQYEWRGVVFEYRSMASAVVTDSTKSGNIGTVVFCANYDVNHDEPLDKKEALNMEYSQSKKINQDLMYPIECKRRLSTGTRLKIRHGDEPLAPGAVAPQGWDRSLYDFCDVYVGSEGASGTGKIGELWITYEVELMKPRYDNMTSGPAIQGDSATFMWPYTIQASPLDDEDPDVNYTHWPGLPAGVSSLLPIVKESSMQAKVWITAMPPTSGGWDDWIAEYTTLTGVSKALQHSYTIGFPRSSAGAVIKIDIYVMATVIPIQVYYKDLNPANKGGYPVNVKVINWYENPAYPGYTLNPSMIFPDVTGDPGHSDNCAMIHHTVIIQCLPKEHEDYDESLALTDPIGQEFIYCWTPMWWLRWMGITSNATDTVLMRIVVNKMNTKVTEFEDYDGS